MENSFNKSQEVESLTKIEQRKLRNEFCVRHGLEVVREEVFNNTPSVVVGNGFEDSAEVHIGFPDGIKHGLAATDTIKGIKMGMYGHGIWRRSILE